MESLDRITLSEGDSCYCAARRSRPYQPILARHGPYVSWPGRSICTPLRLFHNSTVTTSLVPDRLTTRLSAGSLRHLYALPRRSAHLCAVPRHAQPARARRGYVWRHMLAGCARPCYIDGRNRVGMPPQTISDKAWVGRQNRSGLSFIGYLPKKVNTVAYLQQSFN